jgi:hypothetical protein
MSFIKAGITVFHPAKITKILPETFACLIFVKLQHQMMPPTDKQLFPHSTR